jgi:transglutaminase-like putative cysteine protease
MTTKPTISKNILFGCLVLFATERLPAQNSGFDFGKITYQELDLVKYERDTSAVAVVLNEFGEAFFDLESLNKIILQYHIKIKILKESGKEYADFEIPMRRSGTTRQEYVRNIRASSFNRDGGSWKETALLTKNIFTEKATEDYWLTKFAVPDVRVGSVIEVYYELETPYTYNFIPWKFQSEIPKVKSEYKIKFPAYYDYGITLKGYLNLTKNDVKIDKNCVGSSGLGAGSADCSVMHFAMENIPAFKEEDYMTAKKNFLSAITFELAKITHPDGRVDKVTTEWKDAVLELKQHDNFGIQIKKARNLFDDKAALIMAAEKDPLAQCKSIYDFIRNSITWNGESYFLTENGIKKTVEMGKGNVADVNLALLCALQSADLQAEPILISTRANGLPIKHYPVLSDFNYVIVRVKIADAYYFLDATSQLYPFGFIPERCLNGQGRSLGEASDWIDIKPKDKRRTVTDIRLKLDEKGNTSGLVTVSHNGYAAYEFRNSYVGFSNKEEYFQKRTANWNGIAATNFSVENEKDLTKPFIEKFDMSLEDNTGGAGIIYFEPFIIGRISKNPFTSNERLYPVDFGAPTETVYLLTLEYPSDYEPEDVPANVAIALPQGGGRMLFSVTKMSGKLILTSSLSLNKSVYTSEEYHPLKELYTRFISLQQAQFVLKKK